MNAFDTDIFDTPLDENRERVSLRNTLALARGFGVFFVVCNDVMHLQDVFAELVSQFEGAEHHRLSWGCTSLLREVEGKCNNAHPLFISRIDAAMSGDGDPALHAFTANLNATRNSMIVHCQRPLVLGVGEYALKALANGAPDFFSLRSGMFWLPKSNTSTELLPLNFQYDLPLFSQGANYSHLLDTLAKTRNSPDSDPTTIALLARFQASELMVRGQWRSADYAIRQALYSFDKSIERSPNSADLRGGKAICFLTQARILRCWGKPGGVRTAYARASAALEKMHRLGGSKGLVDVDYHLQMGTDMLDDGHFTEAEVSLQEAVRVANLLNPSDFIGLNKTRGYIAVTQGVLFQKTDRLMEAEVAYRSVLEFEGRQNHPDIALPLLRLAMLHEQMGRTSEAATEFAKAIWQSAFSDFWVNEGFAAPSVRNKFLTQALGQWAKFQKNCGFPERAERLYRLQNSVEHGDPSHLPEILGSIRQEITHMEVISAA